METIDCYCETTRISQVSKFFKIAGQEIYLTNVKCRVCVNCGEVYIDGETLLAIETEILQNAAVV